MTLVKTLCGGVLTVLIALVSHLAIAGATLITREEAQLPTPKGAAASRAITRGPHIDLAGFDSKEMHSPVRLQLKFRGFGGATIDLDSLRVTYVKTPNIDLTSRVRPYAELTGIEIPAAEVPPGEHLIRMEVHDSEGRRTTTTFVLNVAP